MHPQSRLLIEMQSQGKEFCDRKWKLTDRKTTPTGFSKDHVVLESNLDSYGRARSAFNAMKRGMVAVLVLGATSAHSEPPEPFSKQFERMSPYGSFIQLMKTPGGSSCCNSADGRMGDGGDELREERYTDKDGNQHYRVFVTRNIFGTDSHADKQTLVDKSYDGSIPPEGRWFNIPDDRVLAADQKSVKECLHNNPLTCQAPPNNVLWLSTIGTVFCYWPLQNWSALPKPRYATLEP